MRRSRPSLLPKAQGCSHSPTIQGLEVEALGGAPGIHSARWGGPNKAFDLAMARVHHELKKLGTSDRRANFTCALALAVPDGEVAAFTGQVYGTIVWPPRGTRGFGYDPIFVPEGYSETFGEIEPEVEEPALAPHARLREINVCDLCR
jgi:XTP/dITP diphosphohydrolase